MGKREKKEGQIEDDARDRQFVKLLRGLRIAARDRLTACNSERWDVYSLRTLDIVVESTDGRRCVEKCMLRH